MARGRTKKSGARPVARKAASKGKITNTAKGVDHLGFMPKGIRAKFEANCKKYGLDPVITSRNLVKGWNATVG